MIINGTARNDKLTGTAQADVISGLAGNDTISGMGGADKMNGGNGNDFIGFANDAAADSILGGTGVDTLLCPIRMAGPIRMTGSLFAGGSIFANNVLIASFSEMEAINITASNANDSVLGGVGNDFINAMAGRDTVAAGNGADDVRIALDAFTDSIDMGAGNDRFTASYGGAASINLTFLTPRASATFQFGAVTAATVVGVEAIDVIAGAGNDTLNGGNFNDNLNAGTGANVVFGGAGNDTFTFILDGKVDDLRGGDGLDRIKIFSDGLDRVVAQLTGPGFYDVWTNNAKELSASGIEAADVTGGAAADIIDGLVGDDNLLGLSGNDTIDGGGGNDNLQGGNGDDSVYGGLGADLIQGGPGNDTVTGRNDADRYIVNHVTGDGIDFVVDFLPEDFLVVRAEGFRGLVAGQRISLVESANPLPPPRSTTPVFLYDTDTGNLAYDFNGALAGAGITFISLHAGTNGARPALLDADQILVI